MNSKLVSIALGVLVFGGAAGYQYYLDTDLYRGRFEPKFHQLKVGDTYERMRDLLGKPNRYCPVVIKDSLFGDAKVVGRARYEMYRIADFDYLVHFDDADPTPASPITGLEVTGRAKRCLGIKH